MCGGRAGALCWVLGGGLCLRGSVLGRWGRVDKPSLRPRSGARCRWCRPCGAPTEGGRVEYVTDPPSLSAGRGAAAPPRMLTKSNGLSILSTMPNSPFTVACPPRRAERSARREIQRRGLLLRTHSAPLGNVSTCTCPGAQMRHKPQRTPKTGRPLAEALCTSGTAWEQANRRNAHDKGVRN